MVFPLADESLAGSNPVMSTHFRSLPEILQKIYVEISSLEVMTINYKIVDGLWGSIPRLIAILQQIQKFIYE